MMIIIIITALIHNTNHLIIITFNYDNACFLVILICVCELTNDEPIPSPLFDMIVSFFGFFIDEASGDGHTSRSFPRVLKQFG